MKKVVFSDNCKTSLTQKTVLGIEGKYTGTFIPGIWYKVQPDGANIYGKPLPEEMVHVNVMKESICSFETLHIGARVQWIRESYPYDPEKRKPERISEICLI